MADSASGRSRSVRSETRPTARHQTGALHAAGVDYGRLITERGRQDHAGQHGSIVEGPSFEGRSNSPLITDVSTSRTPTTSFKIENPNLAEHSVDDSGGETRRRDGPVIGESASVDAPRALRAESNAGDDHAVEAPRAHRGESNASSPTKFPIPTIEAPMRALIGRILRAEATLRATTSGRNFTRHYNDLHPA